MGIFHSTTTRFTASKTPDEEKVREDESVAYPNLQNQYQSHGDSWLKTSLLSFSSIYKATKCLLQKVCVVFNFLRPRKTAADPLLPIRNPASTALCQPLLLPSPLNLICSPNDSSNSLSILENTFDDDADESENDGRECRLEENYSAERNDDDEIDRELLVSAAEIRWSNDVEEIGASAADCRSPCSVDERSSGVNAREEEREREEDVKVQVKNINVGVDEKERRIKHYRSSHKILLVGEGDFSFSACLALAFGSAPNIIATSLNSKAFLKKNYGNAMSNISELRSRGSKVIHGIDATEIANHELLRQHKFDRIIFNFPFAGFFPKLSTQDQLRNHRRLVSLFLKNAKEMISENGEIHISHKTNSFHADFNLENIASSHGLRLIQAVKFKLSHYPGYETKFGFGGDRNFHCYPSKTFKFGLKSTIAPL